MSEKYRARPDGFGGWIIDVFDDGEIVPIIIAIVAILVFGIFWLAYEILRTKIGRIVVICLAVIIAVIALIYSSTHDEFHEVANFQLLDDGTYELLGAKGFECVDIVIPSKYKGSPVTRISDNAFKECTFANSIHRVWNYHTL